MNKTSFNGLYRENKKVFFNVPFNNKESPYFFEEENIRACSKALQNVIIQTGDYSQCENFIDEQTFVYIDPPYRPLTKTSTFTSYTQNNFSDKEQIELGNFIKRISNKGAKILISNSDPKNVNKNDNFFDELYKDLKGNYVDEYTK